MRVLVTGATGLVGHSLLQEIDDAVVVSRRAVPPEEFAQRPNHQFLQWAEPATSLLPIPKDSKIDAVVNLMGESLADGRWTTEKRQRIRESRIAATAKLVESLGFLKSPPQVLVSASAMGFYGSRGEHVLDEAAASGTDFLAEVCRDWEAAAVAARRLGIRVVLLRFGLVLGRGGFLEKVLPIFRLGLGGKLGNGRQWMSWIHIQDLVQLILCCCRDSDWNGPVNAASPFPVRNYELTRGIAQAVGRPAILPVPRLALRIVLGEMSSMLLASIRMNPSKAIMAGFPYQFPRIQVALEDLV